MGKISRSPLVKWLKETEREYEPRIARFSVSVGRPTVRLVRPALLQMTLFAVGLQLHWLGQLLASDTVKSTVTVKARVKTAIMSLCLQQDDKGKPKVLICEMVINCCELLTNCSRK